MKFILEVTIVFAMVVVGEGYLKKGFCPPDKPLRYCFIAPCLYTKCPAHPDAKCVNNFCGGCKADFYVGNKEVDCTVSPCRPPLIHHLSKAPPCDVTKCPAYPKATCVNNYCGGCFADYYLNGQKVNCKKVLPIPPVTLPASCAAVTCFEDHKCVVIDGKAACKPVCKSESDCKQQGSYCDTDSGVCKCQRLCPFQHQLPVCGSDGERYGSLCLLNASACRKGTTITTVLTC